MRLPLGLLGLNRVYVLLLRSVGLHVRVDVLEVRCDHLLLLWGQVLLLIVDRLLELGGILSVQILLIKSARGHLRLRDLTLLLLKPWNILVLKVLNVIFWQWLEVLLLHTSLELKELVRPAPI